jgi:hypothetical protein
MMTVRICKNKKLNAIASRCRPLQHLRNLLLAKKSLPIKEMDRRFSPDVQGHPREIALIKRKIQHHTLHQPNSAVIAITVSGQNPPMPTTGG